MKAKTNVQRICVRAKPKAINFDYFEWQTAKICVLIAENDKVVTLELVRRELERRRWDFISYESKSTLIEERVHRAGGEIWEAYQSAQKGDLVFKIFPEHYQAGNKNAQYICSIRITEQFIDKVVNDAGGRRLSENEKKPSVKNADYLIGDFVFELKDLQEEGLEKGGHQKKLAELFTRYYPEKNEIAINPDILSESDYLKYLNIIGAPIKTHVRSASRQIKETKRLLNRPNLLGGLILLNTGFGSFPHEAFAEQVERYARKDSKQFIAIVSINIYSYTNGFDSYMFYDFSPDRTQQKEVIALREAFLVHFTQMMMDVVRGNIPEDVERASPIKPVTFKHQGLDLAWIPSQESLPWENDLDNLR